VTDCTRIEHGVPKIPVLKLEHYISKWVSRFAESASLNMVDFIPASKRHEDVLQHTKPAAINYIAAIFA
jgi:hypothetical protein